jgi:hypothetical protein
VHTALRDAVRWLASKVLAGRADRLKSASGAVAAPAATNEYILNYTEGAERYGGLILMLRK